MIFKKWKLRTQLMLYSLCLTVMLLLALGLFSYQTAAKMITAGITENSLATLEQINRLASEWTSSFEFLSLSMVMDNQLHEALGELQRKERLDQVEAVNSINERMVFYRSFRDDIRQITIYTNRADLSPYYMDWGYQGLMRFDTEAYREISGYLSGDNTGLIPLHETRPERDVLGANTTRVISYYRRIKIFPGDEEVGILCIDVQADAISQLLSTQLSGDDLYFMVDREQRPIAFGENRQQEAAAFLAENQTLLHDLGEAKGQQTISYEGKRYLVLYSSYNRFGQRTVHLRPYADITDGLGELLLKMILFAAGCLAVSSCWVAVFCQSFVRPIGELVGRMEQVGSGDFQVEPIQGFSNEIGRLSRRFVWMTQELQELIRRLELVSVQKTQAEFETLQQQINPHFLYNTLDCINWMAIQSRAVKISEAVSLLGRFFRTSLSDGATVVPLDRELERLRVYVELQNMRLEHPVRYREELPQELTGLRIVRLVLQPFVENAVIHGLSHNPPDGEIVVSGWAEEQDFYLEISDNGCGVDASRMNRYMLGLEPRKKGYGIYNVNQRIRLYYGEEYGATYLTVVKGTTVVIRLPRQQVDCDCDGGKLCTRC